jgi:YVTN family beta-propeller protein
VLGVIAVGGLLCWGMALAQAAPFAYITNSGDHSVSVIDTATNSVVATVPVGTGCAGFTCDPFGVAVHPAGTFVYVTNPGSNNVSVIDTATNTVVATVPVGLDPFGVAVHPAGTFVYVTNNGVGDYCDGSGVSVLDTATNSVVATVSVGDCPVGVAVHPAGTFVYVANAGSGVSVISTTTTVVATVPVGPSSPVAFGQFVGPQLPGMSFTLNHAPFQTESQLILNVQAAPGASPVHAAVYIALQLPGCTSSACRLFWQGGLNFTATPQPLLRNWPISPFSGPIFNYTFSGTEPVGTYAWVGGFTMPGTETLIGGIAHAPFTFSP